MGNWANRWLSYTGRLQLIGVVLFSIVNFWCRQLILPCRLIKKVEQLCARFPWKGRDVPAKGARFSWENIYFPKAEGGLGVRGLKVKCRPSFRWGLRKILKLKSVAVSLMGRVCDWRPRFFWDEIRGRNEKVTLHRLVWFSMNVPKHAFICWLAILVRLPTAHRLARMGMSVDDTCKLCGIRESRDHIFLECVFSKEVWEGVLRLCCIDRAVGG
ncbi:hypothetical protein F3Y22_tig00109957pilonHSYRG00173 [Hibiscus syriacus]|uniref:Reverse transcriptase zinc-binding domain-containing protein n=1 Tax=Hibiscus syriacus TaxID=106335 RepID=A0A6A3BU93_HIBSY|nr:hypothetical protein F3Y22_tig00109957pilonHSYRG00173 [Hibiscus syriacus]